jgi:hypothetical protein
MVIVVVVSKMWPKSFCHVQGSLIRRCRVFEEHDNRWNYVIPGQTWKDGEASGITVIISCMKNLFPPVLLYL